MEKPPHLPQPISDIHSQCYIFEEEWLSENKSSLKCICFDDENGVVSNCNRPNDFDDYREDMNPPLTFFDLEPHDIFPEIFQNLELKDVLNFSLVSKSVFDLTSPEIVSRSKIVFKTRTPNRREFLEIQAFKRRYNEIEFKLRPQYIIETFQNLMELNVFQLKTVVIPVGDITSELDYLKALEEIGGFAKFSLNYSNNRGSNEVEEAQPYMNQVTKFNVHQYSNNVLDETSKVAVNSHIKDIALGNINGEQYDFLNLPNLKVLRLSSYSVHIANILRNILNNGLNRINSLFLKGFLNTETFKEILEKNSKSLKRIEIDYWKSDFNLLPAQPRHLRIFNGSCPIYDLNQNGLLKGQRNLEILHLKNSIIDHTFLDILLKNRNLFELSIDEYYNHIQLISEKTLDKKYTPIFTRLQKFTFKGSPEFFDMVAKYLVNVVTLSVDSTKRMSAKYRIPINLEKLQVLTMKGEARGMIPLFKNSFRAPNLYSIDIEYSEKRYVDVKSLEQFNNSVKYLKMRNWLYWQQVVQIIDNFTDLETFIFKTTDNHGAYVIMKKIFETKRSFKCIHILVYDWEYSFRQLRKALDEIRPNFEILGNIQGSCVDIEIIFENGIGESGAPLPPTMYISKSIKDDNKNVF